MGWILGRDGKLLREKNSAANDRTHVGKGQKRASAVQKK
jgi:hypothetical protein